MSIAAYDLAAWRVSRALLLGVDRDSALALEFARLDRDFVGLELEGDVLLAFAADTATAARVLVVGSGRSVASGELAVSLETWDWSSDDGWQLAGGPVVIAVAHLSALTRSLLRVRDGAAAFRGDDVLAATAQRRRAESEAGKPT